MEIEVEVNKDVADIENSVSIEPIKEELEAKVADETSFVTTKLSADTDEGLALPASRFTVRSREEEDDIFWSFFRKGYDLEDYRYIRNSFFDLRKANLEFAKEILWAPCPNILF